MTRRRLVPPLAALALAGCSRTPPPPPAPMSAAEAERCTAVSDSVFALPDSALPEVRDARSWRPPPMPNEVRRDGALVLSVRVLEDGRPNLGTLQVQRPTNLSEGSLRQIKSSLERATLVPARVAGCPVQSIFRVVVETGPR